jgi:hypothetical protein
MLFVEDEPLMDPRECSVDWHALVKSLVAPGEYTLFTCACGDAGCAGLDQKHTVTHLPHSFHWDMRRSFPWADLEFDRTLLFQHTLETLEEIRSLAPKADYGDDFPVLPASLRDCSLDWCLRTIAHRPH